MQYIKPYNHYKALIAGIDTKVPLLNGSYTTAINFDNAATTPPFLAVLEELMDFSPWYASVHRGAGYKSQFSSKLYEEARESIANFVGADSSEHTVVFVKNTTEAINKLSNRLLEIYKDGVVLSTCMEHHSNDLPWRNKYKVDYIELDKDGRLSLEDLKKKLQHYDGKVKLVAVTGASNVTGYINPIHEIAEMAHGHGAEILVDGAQLVPHTPVDMKSLKDPGHIDYLVFSGHKMYAPFGSGVLIGPKKTFQQGSPDCVGGGTVELVTHDYIKWQPPPSKEEAGTPNIMGVLAIVTSLKMLKSLGMEAIDAYEKSLTQYTLESLKNVPHIQLYGNPHDIKDRVSIIPFNIEGLPHDIIANALSQEGGIAVRNGCFCAQPYVQRLLNVSNQEMQQRIANPTLPHPGLVRVSFGLYNTYDEIDQFISLLCKISVNRKYYLEKYNDG
ncbi:aminotransferase class V-fold PLP-dependent enzyme [Natronincola ferrireducens]|uniref:Selenocysteine lyase/Cysteine desulfurase n=1 Tax=Natronincola ferrireducens TaxID=393762 RepID=A0A1G8YCE7_9FIRM|nr:aminotransferase class V-fold PLP-dependent enzyme [Natronincola ferrireducens]SDK00376.1 Selenocysteine lyase/Cysteine desulfurase [Natronincola ferrireducens]